MTNNTHLKALSAIGMLISSFAQQHTLQNILLHICAPLPQKGALSRWGPTRATGREVKDDHYVLHLTPTLHMPATVLSVETRA